MKHIESRLLGFLRNENGKKIYLHEGKEWAFCERYNINNKVYFACEEYNSKEN